MGAALDSRFCVAFVVDGGIDLFIADAAGNTGRFGVFDGLNSGMFAGSRGGSVSVLEGTAGEPLLQLVYRERELRLERAGTRVSVGTAAAVSDSDRCGLTELKESLSAQISCSKERPAEKCDAVLAEFAPRP